MKKTIFFIAIFFINFVNYAQSAEKSLAYINQHKTEVFLPRSYAMGIVHGNQIEFTADHIKLSSNNGNETLIEWKQIINVNQTDQGEYGELEIISKDIHEGENVIINLSMQDDDFRLKFLKAIKKIAKKQGAKFVKIEVDEGY